MTQDSERVRILDVEEVARTGFSVLRRTKLDYCRSDGSWQTIQRETYDRGNGAAILLYDPSRDCVLLIKQFRYPAFANPRDGAGQAERGWTIEVPAGLLDDHIAAGRSAEDAIRREAEEETGVLVAQPARLLDVYTSPGSVTERLALFVATYRPADRIGPGGGLADEGEDTVVMEPTLAEAAGMIASGEIADAKTILLIYWAHLHRAELAGDAGPGGASA